MMWDGVWRCGRRECSTVIGEVHVVRVVRVDLADEGRVKLPVFRVSGVDTLSHLMVVVRWWCTYVCMCACVHVCMCVCVLVCMCACVCVCVHVCVCLCVYVCV